MVSYLVRRLLLMIPTLIGITFHVFMLVALAPGGVGAALAMGGGEGVQSGQERAKYEAYLEDRYGLKDPVIVQYGRWLGRVSPLKFGRPDQIDGAGTIQRAPKRLQDPPLLGVLYGDPNDLAEQTAGDPVHADLDVEERQRLYRQVQNTYVNKRAAFVAERTVLERLLVAYARSIGRDDLVNIDDDPIVGRFADLAGEFDATSPDGAAIVAQGEQAIAAFNEAVEARAAVSDAWASSPFPDNVWRLPWLGVPIQIGNIVHLATPDLGFAYSKTRPVGSLIAEALPVTLLLNAIAVPIIYLIAVPSGMLAAARQGSWFDIGSGAFFVALWSVPVVWAGVLAVGYLANDDYLGWFPVSGLHDPAADEMLYLPSFESTKSGFGGDFERGYLLDLLWHICLPVACLVYAGFAILSKQTRAAMLDNFSADYVRTAKAKGVAASDIVFRHVFRNSLLPLITMFASVFPAMLAGSVVIEHIFSVPGMGSLVLDAIEQRDRELLLANALMIGGVNLLALLLADILYAMADPRITFE